MYPVKIKYLPNGNGGTVTPRSRSCGLMTNYNWFDFGVWWFSLVVYCFNSEEILVARFETGNCKGRSDIYLGAWCSRCDIEVVLIVGVFDAITGSGAYLRPSYAHGGFRYCLYYGDGIRRLRNCIVVVAIFGPVTNQPLANTPYSYLVTISRVNSNLINCGARSNRCCASVEYA